MAVGDAAKVAENAAATTIAVLANDTDVDGGPKSVAAITQPAHGAAAITGGGAGVTYTPARGYCNTGKGSVPDTFSYTLNGGSQATVAVTVACTSQPRLTIGHRAARTTRTATSIRLTCKVARCKGTLSLQADEARHPPRQREGDPPDPLRHTRRRHQADPRPESRPPPASSSPPSITPSQEPERA